MKIKSLFLAAAGLLAMASCTEEKFDLGVVDVSPEDLVEGVAYTVTHDSSNPNIIYLKSLLPSSYNVAWETPQGRIVAPEATLKIAFDGDYEFRMAVNTRGGYVWSNPGHFTINDFCADFVSHYLWTRLTGGVGNSKLWQLDLQINDDGSNKTTRFKGPHWFWNINYTWDKLHAASENETTYNNFLDSTPWDSANAIDPTETGADALGSDSNWYWGADYAGNSWMCEAQNYGFMELNLINGANCIIYDADMNEVSRGTFLLDTDNHTIGFSDVYPLWTTNSNPASNGSKNFNVLYLSDDAMIMFAPGYNTGVNYVTKDYFDNYVEEVGDVEPSLPDGWEDLVSQVVVSTTTIKWTLSTENPTDWCNLDGSRMNGWNSLQDYTDCGWYGTPNPDAYANFSMTLDSENNKATFEYPDGTKVETTYTLNEKGIYTFADAIPSALSGALGDWDSFYVDSNNSLRIMSIEKKAGNLSGMWLGARSDEKDEYHAYHFIPNLGDGGAGGGGGTAALATKYYNFDPSKVNFYNDTNHARLSLNNPWGDPANDALDCSQIGWTNNLAITFRVKGTPAGFTGKACIGLNKNDWSVMNWENNYTCNLNGDGIYTVTYDVEPFNVGDLMMACVEISNLDAETEGLEAEVLSIASDINGKLWGWNPENVNFYNDGAYARISMNNPWGDPANDAIDCAPINWANTFAVTFRLTGTPAGFSGKAGLSLNKNDWSIVLWAPDNLNTNVNGDGTYTVVYDAEPFNAGDLMMFAVEISNLDAETEGLKAEVVDIRTW